MYEIDRHGRVPGITHAHHVDVEVRTVGIDAQNADVVAGHVFGALLHLWAITHRPVQDRVPRGLAGGVRHHLQASKEQPEFRDAEQQQEQDRQDEHHLHHGRSRFRSPSIRGQKHDIPHC